MKRFTILSIIMISYICSIVAQTTIATYDVNDDKQTTVIIKDTKKTDKDILAGLDLDDYTIGEEVYITAEMWDKMQEKKEKGENPIIKESPSEEKIVIEEKITKKPARAKKAKSTSTAKKSKKKKSKKFRVKKSKRKKVRSSRRGKMACYSF